MSDQSSATAAQSIRSERAAKLPESDPENQGGNGGAFHPPSEASFRNARNYLVKVDRGEEPFDLTAGGHPYQLGTYSHNALIYLSNLLGMSRKELVTLAVSHYRRSLTSRMIASQNDLGVLLHAMQYAVHDLALEIQAFNELTISVADQEAHKQPPPS